ncbi:mandelate racemase/muconate lactonizing enzyme family protein [Reyranella sp. CPCC 100927]|uniref:mandelate racemase/muconate lactonizing enzyme family protein n=1 Tax=Reyranella sp. CPCC 100927 TaxID=2599616 RepID=UPI0015B53872|nr:mandelate racemase/muconate lactonizing enzyme family protein [Reyranella sp. CPCC 100927]
MPTIERLGFIGLEYAMPPEKAFGMSRAIGNRRLGGLIELETDTGVRGVGEAFGDPRVTAAYFQMIEPLFRGRSIYDFDHVEAGIRNRMYHLGAQNQLTACLSGINLALHDAIGRTHGVRACDLIGGCATTRLPVYASTGFFSKDPTNQLEHQLAAVKAHPYVGAKIKIGRGPQDDAARCRLAREMLGDDALLIVDVNGNYTVDMALACIRAIERYDIHWLEEPLPPADLRGYAELRARSPIPVAAGEAHYTLRDFKQLIDGRCVDIVQPSIPTVGGLTEARRIAVMAHAANLRVSPHAWGGAVGLAAALHLVASLPVTPHGDNVPYPTLVEYDMSDNPLRTNLLSQPLVLDGGHLLLPSGPGLGVTLDRAVVDRYRVC